MQKRWLTCSGTSAARHTSITSSSAWTMVSELYDRRCDVKMPLYRWMTRASSVSSRESDARPGKYIRPVDMPSAPASMQSASMPLRARRSTGSAVSFRSPIAFRRRMPWGARNPAFSSVPCDSHVSSISPNVLQWTLSSWGAPRKKSKNVKISALCFGNTGAIDTPQLPPTNVVMPWRTSGSRIPA